MDLVSQNVEDDLGTKNSVKIYNAFNPVWWFLVVMGQMPFRVVKTGTDESPIYNFRFSTVSLQTVVYGLVFILFSVFYFVITVGIAFFFLDGYTLVPKENVRDPIIRMYVTVSLEKLITRDQLIPMFVIWSLMTITFVGFIAVFLKGSNIVQYFNYWNRVVTIIDIDPTVGVRRYFILQNVVSIVVAVVFSSHFAFGFAPFEEKDRNKKGLGFSLAGQQANMVFGMLTSVHDSWQFQDVTDIKDAKTYPAFGITFVLMLYGIIGSRVQIVPFLFYCLLLKNGSEIWNARFRNLLTRVKLHKGKQSLRRVNYTDLIKDHLVLVQLFKMTENTFSVALIVFYAANLFCIILEMYYLATRLLAELTSPVALAVIIFNRKFTFPPTNDTGAPPIPIILPDPADIPPEEIDVNGTEFVSLKDKFIPDGIYELDKKEYDDSFLQVVTFILVSVLMAYQIFTTYQVTYQATEAYEHAMTGFAILRRFGYMHCDNKTERNFMHTLVFSFAKNNPMWITGGGYFAINSALILGMVGNMVNYVVFMYQFKPDDWDDLEYFWKANSSR